MRTLKLKIKQDDLITSFAIPAACFFLPESNSWNYLNKYKVEHANLTWHGRLEEPPEHSAPGKYLLVNSEIAKNFNLADEEDVQLSVSTSDEIENIQLLRASEPNVKRKLTEGIEVKLDSLISYENRAYKVQSYYPKDGYLSTNTIIEPIGNQSPSDKQSDDDTVKDSSSSMAKKFVTAESKQRSTGFAKLVGIDPVIKEVENKILFPLKNPELTKKILGSPLKGAILHGPFGIGKTALARAISEEAGLPFYRLPKGLTSNPFVGAEVINELYEKARKGPKGAIIFIDEIDTVAPKDAEWNPVISTLQECMDGFQQNGTVFTLGATNYLERIADGLMRSGRFDLIIEMKLPDADARKELFDYYLSGLLLGEDIDSCNLSSLTDSYSSADIQTVVKTAGLKALERSVNMKPDRITKQDLVLSVQSYRPTGARIMDVVSPKFTFEDMFGYEELITDLKRNLDLISGKKQAKYSNAKDAKILFTGPPGTGKTTIAQAIASYLGAKFIYRSATSFKSKWVGETESRIRQLFSSARTYSPIVIFIDEIDALARSRRSDNSHGADALNELLVQLEGFNSNKGIYFIAATNRVDQLDEAILSRMGYQIEMPLPDLKQREQLIEGLFNNLPKNNLNYKSIAQLTNGWSQRDLCSLKNTICMKLDLEEIQQLTTEVMVSLIKNGATNTTQNQI